jgi:twitching motility two-component system response regulator PilG
VSGVTDGKSALEQICADRPDLVLLDIMLPLVDGFEVCRCLKENPETRAIPVVLLTARKNGQDYTRAMEVGADAYITKPFRSAHLAETIAGLLAGGNNGS